MTENAFKYAPGGLLDDISTFDQLMTACNIHMINIGSGNALVPDGTSHYLNQCWTLSGMQLLLIQTEMILKLISYQSNIASINKESHLICLNQLDWSMVLTH